MKGSSSPPPGSSTEPQGFGVEEPTSDAEISVTIDPDEIAAFSREAATATRVDEEIDTRAKRSVLVGSDRPPALESSAPEQGYGSSSRPSRFVDRYELIGLLGVGGMGSVYRVRDLILQEEVALKILRKDLAEVASAVERFRSEVRLTRRITHPNVVRIHDIGEHRGEHFYTMECIVGDPLSAAMGKGAAMDVVRAYEYGVQIAEGLAAVHQANVVHRDLKPDNLMVSREGRVVITDFGVAVLRDGPSVDVLPLRGAGTPRYMAPEQLEGRSLTEKTDLYALGLILFELLTGDIPWPKEDPNALDVARLSVPASSIHTINPRVPESLGRVVLALLERDPGGRPDSALALVEMLKQVRGEIGEQQVAGAEHGLQQQKQWPTIATTNTPHLRSVGVMAFRNLGDPKDNYIAEALSMAIVDRLVVCPTVRVAKRFALRGPDNADVQFIGRQAGVDVVVEGTLSKRASGAMAVTARVVEVERGFVLWAQRFQSSAADLFDLQAKLSASLAEVLTLEEHSHRGGSGPADRENVDSFLRAQHALGEWTSHGCETAVHLLENAHQISPRDPLLMAWLALARFRSWYLLVHASEGVATEGLRLSRLALDINENLGEAHLGLSIYALYNANWIVAARRAEEAIRCNPALSEAHWIIGVLHCAANRVEQGLGMIDLALRLEPRNLAALWDAAYVEALCGHRARAAEYLDKADQVYLNHPETLLARIRIGLWMKERMMIAWARENMASVDGVATAFQSAAIRMFLEPEPDEEVGTLTALAAGEDTPLAARARIMQLVAERMAIGGMVDDAWSALRAASAHAIDAIWFMRCPVLERMASMPAFLSLRSHIAARAAQVFEAP
ncbi:MAG TPA: protein kinase [Polyangiaceae bacterium]|nr:protein kinase [Polyangiaceae bacterium]